MKILILEDDENRIEWFLKTFAPHELRIERVATGAIHAIREEKFDHIFLDHDLGVIAATGMWVAKYMARHPKLAGEAKITIHSVNIDGAKNMLSVLKEDHKVRILMFTRMMQLRRDHGGFFFLDW